MVDCPCRESFAELLKAYGHDARIAHDGQEAVTCAESQTPDVALVDIGMPKLNGYQVATRLRKSCPTTLLIAVSGWGSPSDKRKAVAAGFHHHFVKPLWRHLQPLRQQCPRTTDRITGMAD